MSFRLQQSAWRGALAAVLIGLSAPAFAQAPPALDLTLTPTDEALQVEMRLAAPGLKGGEGLVRLPLSLVGIPSARYDGEALQARDDLGVLPLRQSEEAPTPQGVYRRWSVTRETQGDVVVTYAAPPRAVSAATNNGPLFDLRAEAGGFMGAGVGFLATPVAEGPWSVRMRWDLTQAPAHARGAWTFGDGEISTVLPSQALSFSYYAGGPLKAYPEAGEGGFHMYWLSDPPFSPAELAEKTRRIYDEMSAFFGDPPGTPYRVFMRRNPYTGTGGTALGRSFMFGYHAPSEPAVDDLLGLVSHEVAHAWPRMQGEHGDTAWYSEGMAEYYSLVLGWRAGVFDTDKVLQTMNDRAQTYYANPYIGLPNAQAAELFWRDPVAQTVPYGRGWMYLLQTDAEIRRASAGARSLDDVVKAMRARDLAGQTYGIPDWLDLVGAEIGPERARAQYEAMAVGGRLQPPEGLYEGCLTVVETEVAPFELGFSRKSLDEGERLQGLVAGSAAARAGLKDGDVILEMLDYNTARKAQDGVVTIVVDRDGAPVPIRYVPRATPVAAWGWARDPASAPACRF